MPSGENEILVYTETISSRFLYILDFTGSQLGIKFIASDNEDQFRNFPGPTIDYSHKALRTDSFIVQPSALLFENGIRRQKIECFTVSGYKAFYKAGGDHPFDILAASFYLLSRYEEYLSHETDEYGRYDHKSSLAFREGFLQIPLVNTWLLEFESSLKKKFPGFETKHHPFRFIPTYDIDEAYSFLHKQWWRSIGGMARSVIQGNFSSISERINTLLGKNKDPFDSYQWMHGLHQRYNLDPTYFFHVGLRNSRYDKNILPYKSAVKNLIREHAEKYSVGIHPSWKSTESPELLKLEILKLTHLAGKQITHSRQHFIKFSLPMTYRQLIENDIRHEFSMGYGSINGFRASVASPFYWYDLENEKQTGLQIYPFCYMDANSFFEQKQGPGEALQEMIDLYNAIRSVNGTMITIWHNTFLGTSKLFSGWRDTYEKFISSIH